MSTTKKLEVKHTVEVIDYKNLDSLNGVEGQRANTKLIVLSAQRAISKRGGAFKALHADYERTLKLSSKPKDWAEWLLEEGLIFANEREASLRIHSRWNMTAHGLKALFGFDNDMHPNMVKAARQIWGVVKTFGSIRKAIRDRLENAGKNPVDQIKNMVDEMCQPEQPTKITKVA